MDSQHNTPIHIYSVEVHAQTEDICTLYHLPYQMLWHKYDAHVASLYFYMLYICDVLSIRPSDLRILDFIIEFFKYLLRQYSNDECINLAEMQHSQPRMTLYCAEICFN